MSDSVRAVVGRRRRLVRMRLAAIGLLAACICAAVGFSAFCAMDRPQPRVAEQVIAQSTCKNWVRDRLLPMALSSIGKKLDDANAVQIAAAGACGRAVVLGGWSPGESGVWGDSNRLMIAVEDAYVQLTTSDGRLVSVVASGFYCAGEALPEVEVVRALCVDDIAAVAAEVGPSVVFVEIDEHGMKFVQFSWIGAAGSNRVVGEYRDGRIESVRVY